MIYLDHNASTPPDDRVKKAIARALDLYGNPSSTHRPGREAREEIEKARVRLAGLLNAEPDEIIFTSGGTESNNLALIGYLQRFRKGHVISTAIEHPSVINPLLLARELGFELTLLQPAPSGAIDPDDLKAALRNDTVLVSVMHANNETGIIQPIEEIGKILRERDIVFHVDAAQSIGKIPVDVERMGVDLLTVAGHKFYGPKGAGALFKRKGLAISPLLRGASHERGLRPGTECTPLIAGLGEAARIISLESARIFTHLNTLTVRLHELLDSLIEKISLNGTGSRIPNTLSLSIRGVGGRSLVEALSEEVALSAGSACHEGITRPSGVLTAMGIDVQDALSSVRLSTGKDNTLEEMERAANLISRVVKGLRKNLE